FDRRRWLLPVLVLDVLFKLVLRHALLASLKAAHQRAVYQIPRVSVFAKLYVRRHVSPTFFSCPFAFSPAAQPFFLPARALGCDGIFFHPCGQSLTRTF